MSQSATVPKQACLPGQNTSTDIPVSYKRQNTSTDIPVSYKRQNTSTDIPVSYTVPVALPATAVVPLPSCTPTFLERPLVAGHRC